MKRHLAASAFIVFLFLGSSAAQTSLTVSGLTAPVRVGRDARSIPYINAKNDADLYFAQGYVMASDRLWQMDIMRRLARGETSELFGQLTLEEDKRWRRFGFASIAEENLKYLSSSVRAALESYAAGVNAYIATLTPETSPIEFRLLQYKPREWRPSDTILVGKVLTDALSTTWRNDLVRASLQGMPADKLTDLTNSVTPYDVILFGTDKPATRAALKQTTVSLSEGLLAAAEVDETARRASLERIGLYAEGLAASNNWVISGKRTADGKPILANDPHLAPTAPNLWYLVHLTSPTVRVSGVTLPGVPGVVLGHNEHIAWGATNVGPDVQDLYLEILNPQLEYKTPTGWSKMTIREETINVRQNLLDPSTKPEQLNVRETRNGVIIHEEPGKRYALKWTARDPKNTEFEAFFALNRARNWDEFKKALRTYGGASQNFVYADVKGNIAWHVGGRIPVRRAGDGALPYDGSTGEGDWTGFIPFEELPNLYNPASGLIVTANQRIVGTSYKYTQMSRDAAAPWRARRIQDLLEKKTKVTIDEVRDVQHDAYSIPHHKLSEEIRKTGSALPETLAVLDKWDGRMLADSRAALLSHEIRDCLANTIAEANKPVPASVIRERVLDGAISGQIARWLPPSYVSYKDLLIGCDQNVRTSLTARFGSDEATWTWGRTWRSRFPHPMAQAPLIGMQFATPSVPIDGSGVTPNVGSAVSMRHIASPGNWDATRLIIPLGQSGDPNSTHFKDQFELWRTGTPAIFPFTPDAVKKATVASLTLTPKR